MPIGSEGTGVYLPGAGMDCCVMVSDYQNTGAGPAEFLSRVYATLQRAAEEDQKMSQRESPESEFDETSQTRAKKALLVSKVEKINARVMLVKALVGGVQVTRRGSRLDPTSCLTLNSPTLP